jgi:hypothetical protein
MNNFFSHPLARFVFGSSVQTPTQTTAQTMSKQQNSRAQTSGMAAIEVLPPESGEQSAAKPKVKTVLGHRLVDRAEQFVMIDDGPEASTDSSTEATAAEEPVPCEFCGIVFAGEKWDENDDYCPNCNRDVDGNLHTEPRELTEAEILLKQVANDGEYSLNVERLTSFEIDGRTDSRADKTFCTKLKPVTLDYLDTVRRMYGAGTYRFSMYRKGVGLVKDGIWVDTIEKPIEQPAPPPIAAPAAFVAAEKEDPITVYKNRAKELNELKAVLVGDELAQLREEIKQQRTSNNGHAGAPDNPYALFAPLAANNATLAEKLMERAFPEEAKGTWVSDLFAHPQETMTLVGMVLDRVERIFRPQANGNGNGNGHQLTPAPTVNQMLPPAMLAVLDVIGEDILNFEPGEDGELSESVWRAADAIVDAAEGNAEVKQRLDALLAMSPMEIYQLLSGQAGLPVQGIEHLRIVGYEYIAKKKDADVFFRELKQAVKIQQDERTASVRTGSDGGRAHETPASTKEASANA